MSCHTPGCALPRSVCCIVGGRVLLTRSDVMRMGGFAPDLQATDRPGYVAELPRRADGSCSRLAADDSCSIETVKPDDCRRQDLAVCPRLRMPA